MTFVSLSTSIYNCVQKPKTTGLLGMTVDLTETLWQETWIVFIKQASFGGHKA